MAEGYDHRQKTARVSIIRQSSCRIEERGMTIAPASPAVPGITHHRAHVNGTTLHYAAPGTTGTPVLLVHGFPATWRAFRNLLPLLPPTPPVSPAHLPGLSAPT